MGIRYYAYAFDSDQTRVALADPRAVIGSDPLADAWGLEPGFTQGFTGLCQPLPEREFLYLDKAWQYLQLLTAPYSPGASARAAYRMFEGAVTYGDGGLSWDPWVRALPPDEVPRIARDLEGITKDDVAASLGGYGAFPRRDDSVADYACHFLARAKDFVRVVAAEGRGFAYLIG